MIELWIWFIFEERPVVVVCTVTFCIAPPTFTSSILTGVPAAFDVLLPDVVVAVDVAVAVALAVAVAVVVALAVDVAVGVVLAFEVAVAVGVGEALAVADVPVLGILFRAERIALSVG